MTAATFDVIVLGCGGFGSAAASHLARRGLRVLAVDRFTPPHTQGSSHGETRIIRKAYFEHPDYVPLLQRAYQLWEELSVRTADLRPSGERELMRQCGLLLAGNPEGEVIAGAQQAARQHGLLLESLNCDEVARRFPMLSVPEHLQAVFESEAGFLWAERCVAAHLTDAEKHGAYFCFDQPVAEIHLSARDVVVKTSHQTYSAACAVFTAGAWTSQLLPEYSRWIQVKRKVLFWHPTSNPAWYHQQQAPAYLIEESGSGRQFYGFPSIDARTVKLAEHTGGQLVEDPSAVDRVVSEREGSDVAEFAARHLRGVERGAVRSAVCLYSMSPDGHFLLDRLPHAAGVVAAGFSGHGFKFTSVLGEVVADLVIDGKASLPVDFLSATRLSERTDAERCV